ncbi:MAG: glycosyltransferase, partial [Planctomycetes bacterium]|nr:glycosyltransferase [Planctomycetota bacterium]
MKVAYLLKKFPRLSETFILNEILKQQELGLDLHIFSRRTPDDEPRHGALARLTCPIEVLPSSKSMDAWQMLFDAQGQGLGSATKNLWDGLASAVPALLQDRQLRLDRLVAEAIHVQRRCEELGVEHIHVHFATDSAIVAHLVKAMGGPSYSITAHAKDIYRSTVSMNVLSLLAQESEFIVTVCDSNLAYLQDRLTPGAAKHVRRLYNGIDLGHFAFSNRKRATDHVLAVGRLVEKKGFDLLLSATRSLLDQGRDFRVTIIGEGDARPQLEAQVQELGLAGHVTLAGAATQESVLEAMSTATFMCLPCRVGTDGNRDALPTVLLEA